MGRAQGISLLNSFLIVLMSSFVMQFRRQYGSADYRPAFNPLTLLGMLFGLALDFCWEQRYTRMF
jgi:hypothetical protein